MVANPAAPVFCMNCLRFIRGCGVVERIFQMMSREKGTWLGEIFFLQEGFSLSEWKDRSSGRSLHLIQALFSYEISVGDQLDGA